MQISELRTLVSDRLVAFAWNEWAQLGVLAAAGRESPWAADPEALLVFTFQVARDDPRLFDEVLDWLVANGQLVSLQRLHNHTLRADEPLVDACIAWAAANGVRLHPRSPTDRAGLNPEPLFRDMRAASRPDPVFAEYGFARPSTTRSGKSNAPDLMRPIAFTFRLRQVFGVGSRAEVIRFLLTASGTSPGAANPLFTAAVIADAAAYAKRNVQEALNSLALAGAIRQRRRGNELVYSIDTMRWRSFLLGDSPIPQYRDWSQALFTARELHRWITHAESVSLTPYMLASEARRFAEQILPSLYQAGIAVQDPSAAEGEAYWPAFTKLVADFLAQLDSLRPW